MRLNLQLTYKASELDIMKQYALFIKMKSIYEHSIIFNYKPSKLVKITGLHHKTVDRYVKKLVANGFCEFRDGHLLFKSPTKIVGAKSKSVSIEIEKHYRQIRILDLIYLALIKDYLRQQVYNIALRIGRNSIDKAVRLLKNYEIKIGEKNLVNRIRTSTGSKKRSGLDKPIFTTKNLGKLFNTTHKTAQTIVRRLEYYGRIKTRKEFKFIAKLLSSRDYALFKSHNPGSYSVRKGKIFRLIGFSITL